MASDLPAGLQGFDLDGRVAVVTGASSGLGGAVARGLASVGARVAVVARRVDRLESLAEQIGGVAVGCDLLDADQVRRVVDRKSVVWGKRVSGRVDLGGCRTIIKK